MIRRKNLKSNDSAELMEIIFGRSNPLRKTNQHSLNLYRNQENNFTKDKEKYKNNLRNEYDADEGYDERHLRNKYAVEESNKSNFRNESDEENSNDNNNRSIEFDEEEVDTDKLRNRYRDENNFNSNSRDRNDEENNYNFGNRNRNDDGSKNKNTLSNGYSNIKGSEQIDALNNANINNTRVSNISEENKNNLHSIDHQSKITDFNNRLIGLTNIKDYCFMNVPLQILFHTPEFLDTLKSLEYENCNENIIKALINLSEYPNDINCFKKIIQIMGEYDDKYKGTIEIDIQDAIVEILSLLNEQIKKINNADNEEGEEEEKEEEEANKKILISQKNIKIYKSNHYDNYKKNKAPLTFIENMFVITNSFAKLNKKNYLIYFSYNLNFHLELVFPEADRCFQLYELLDNYFQTNKEINYIKRIVSLPKILIISFCRAVENKELFRNAVSFPSTLNLTKFLDEDLYEESYAKNEYTLYAISERLGKTKTGGYNLCHIKINNEWYNFRNMKVSRSIPELISKNVVGLFYLKNK